MNGMGMSMTIMITTTTIIIIMMTIIIIIIAYYYYHRHHHHHHHHWHHWHGYGRTRIYADLSARAMNVCGSMRILAHGPVVHDRMRTTCPGQRSQAIHHPLLPEARRHKSARTHRSAMFSSDSLVGAFSSDSSGLVNTRRPKLGLGLGLAVLLATVSYTGSVVASRVTWLAMRRVHTR